MDQKKSDQHLSFIFNEPSTLEIIIDGKLDQTLLSILWHKVLLLHSKYKPEILILNAKNITDCDSIGAELILELKRRQVAKNKKFHLQNSSEKLGRILHLLEEQKSCTPIQEKRLDFITKIGIKLVKIASNIRENVYFLGMVLCYFFQFALQTKKKGAKLRWQDFWRAMYDVGPKALPIMLSLGFLIGLISTFQSAEPLGRFGAQIYIIDLVGLGLVREIGPLITSVLLAGRTASAFAAEIGAMKINQEVDALATMGIEPIRFLVMPRIFATLLLTPLLSMFFMLAAIFGCFLVMLSLDYSYGVFISELNKHISLTDFFSGLAKTFVFGIVIAGVGCMHGIKTKFGAIAVGDSTTQAVVSSLVMLVAVDGIFAAAYYFLGI